MDPLVSAVIDDLRRTGFRDLAGARISARIPLSMALLNRLAADALRRSTTPVRRVDVRPLAEDRFEVKLSLKWALVPPLTVTLAIAGQPRFQEAPLLTLRWSLPAGLGAIASQFVGGITSLPDGIRLAGDTVTLDLATLARSSAAAEALPHLAALELHTSPGAAVLELELSIEGARNGTA